jgi:4'-phosphopantetheinyl transferase
MARKTASNSAVHDPAEWASRDEPPPLEVGEVHVWTMPLDLTPGQQAALLLLLTEEEQARAQRLVAAEARARFAAARGTLRVLLGGYAGVAPASLTFGVGPGGKPFLAAVPQLQFSLAHSDALALVAVAWDREVGVDVERRRQVQDASALAARYLAADEARALEALPPDARSDGFLRCWTVKEAVLKATGEGLSKALDSFQVAVAPAEPARLVALGEPHGPPDAWALHELAPAPGYVGALAVRGPASRLRRFTLRL